MSRQLVRRSRQRCDDVASDDDAAQVQLSKPRRLGAARHWPRASGRAHHHRLTFVQNQGEHSGGPALRPPEPSKTNFRCLGLDVAGGPRALCCAVLFWAGCWSRSVSMYGHVCMLPGRASTFCLVENEAGDANDAFAPRPPSSPASTRWRRCALCPGTGTGGPCRCLP